MKKFVSILSAVAVLLSSAVLFSSCGKGEVSGKEENLIEELAEEDYEAAEIDIENLKEFTAQGANSKSENSLFVDEESGKSVIINKKKGDALSVGFVISDALFKDIDGDGQDEIYALGEGDVSAGANNVVTVALFRYMNNTYKGKKCTECIGYYHYPDTYKLGFVDKGDKGVNLVRYKVDDKGAKTVIEDYGALSLNGCLLETPKSTIKNKTDKPDMSIFFKRDDVKYYCNGKEFDPGEDFMFKPYDADQSFYVSVEKLEQVSGVKYTGKEDDILKSIIITIYGKKYINAIIVDKYMDLVVDFNTSGRIQFNTKDYKAPQTTKK